MRPNSVGFIYLLLLISVFIIVAWLDININKESKEKEKEIGNYVILNLSGQRGQIVGVGLEKYLIRYETTVVKNNRAGIICESESATQGRAYTTDWFDRFEFRFENKQNME